MVEVKWIKIVTDIFDDEKILLIEGMQDADSIIVLWFKLLCLAGKQNNSGVLTLSNGIPFTEEMLATIFRRKVETVSLGLRIFEQFGMIEIIENAITIPKWGKHQNFDKIEAKNEYQRQYMQEYRSRQKQLAEGFNEKTNSKSNVKVCKTNSKANSKANVSSLDKNREDKIREEKKTSSCAELSAEADTPRRNPILTLTLNDKSEYPIYEEQTHEWAALYPAVDVIQQLRNMKGWLDANPTKRKTKRGILKFINNWLTREQDRSGSNRDNYGKDFQPSHKETRNERNNRLIAEQLAKEAERDKSRVNAVVEYNADEL